MAPERRVEVGETLLAVDNLTMRFGGLVALDDVSFDIRRGEILGLIGPNGAGKTTCFNAMTGVYRPTVGRRPARGRARSSARSRTEITSSASPARSRTSGCSREMTALENVLVGADARHRTRVLGALLRLPRHGREEREAARARDGAAASSSASPTGRHETARNLPYGDQRRLEIARALATEPEAAAASTSRPPASTRPRSTT